MADDRFIWCRNCDAVHHVTSFDKAPLYSYSAGELEQIPSDDWHEFMKEHEGHRLEPLRALGEKYFMNGSSSDPMSVAYVEVTNGQDRLLLRQTRKSIYEPLNFELTAGRLIDQGVAVGIQATEIKQEMRYHFEWSAEPLADEKIQLFIEILEDVAKGIQPKEIAVAAFSSEDANVSFGILHAGAIELLMAKCAAYFGTRELEDFRRFIDSHREPCDVLALVMRRQLKFEDPAVPI
jgi:hypothetical protein